MLLKFAGIYFKALTAYGSELAQTKKTLSTFLNASRIHDRWQGCQG